MLHTRLHTQRAIAFLLLTLTGVLLTGSTALQAATTPRNTANGQQMYAGASMTCLMASDFYAVHFTALQHGRQDGEGTDFVKYCQDIPSTGKTYLTIDLLDRESRGLPIGLRIVEEELSDDGKTIKQQSTLVEVPPRVYKNGVADAHADLSRPGHYALLVTFGDDAEATEDDRLKIPFNVGVAGSAAPSQGMKYLAMFAVVGFFAALGVAGFRTLFPGRSMIATLMAIVRRETQSGATSTRS